ncbi:hypothetical protein BU14_0280s0022 [Porphyra umbilicalis]|uniref:Uncharacterized protein n=1 Tax=Porphyra umbilicalis TaxID=2786 RepID=A0A1X6P1F6_PORUM|nr:hypothetical protein BU14_0280s0022 [Porphyra umbilicalis]|eukprot:OSX74606.1 hypothetical protein BU14_0280s0022 [Porphyra umbilicalis]
MLAAPTLRGPAASSARAWSSFTTLVVGQPSTSLHFAPSRTSTACVDARTGGSTGRTCVTAECAFRERRRLSDLVLHASLRRGGNCAST